MKIFLAEKNVPGMTREEIVNFLENRRMILRLGTLDPTLVLEERGLLVLFLNPKRL